MHLLQDRQDAIRSGHTCSAEGQDTDVQGRESPLERRIDMGRFLATNGALVILGGLIMLSLAAALASRCFTFLIRFARYLIAATDGNLPRKIRMDGITY